MRAADRRLQEGYRRSALFLSKLAKTHRGCAIQVASATRGEGTTTVTLTLARYLHDSFGLRVLVVEGGARDDFARLLGLDRDRTFQGFAEGRLTAGEAVQHTAAGVAVVPTGGPARSIAQFTDRLGGLLQALEIDYDLILLDMPPVLESTEVLSVGALVQQLVLVVESGRTRYEVVQRAQRELEAEGVTIVAAVLNKQKRVIPGWIYRWLNG